MFCSKCGKQIPDDSQFCAGCGYKIGSQVVINESSHIATHQTSTLLISAKGGECSDLTGLYIKTLTWFILGIIALFLRFIILPIPFPSRDNRYIDIIFIILPIFSFYQSIITLLKTVKINKTFIIVYNNHLEGIGIKDSSPIYFNLTYKQIVSTGAALDKNELLIRTDDSLYTCYAKNPNKIEEIILERMDME